MEPSGEPAEPAEPAEQAENEADGDVQKMSKNQLKRLRRQEMSKAARQYEKARKKAKQQEAREQRQQQLEARLQALGDDEEAKAAMLELVRKRSAEARRERSHAKVESRARMERAVAGAGVDVVIDLAWAHLMNARQYKSLKQQVAHCYGIVCRSPDPFHLHLTGLSDESPLAKEVVGISGFERWLCSKHKEDVAEAFRDRIGDVVYLTADGDEVLETIERGKVYVIGGLIDRNHHKGVCLAKAREMGCRAAKLPIRELVSMSGSHVLTVNQVVSILDGMLSRGSAREAIAAALPQRKRNGGSEAGSAGDGDEGGDDGDDGDGGAGEGPGSASEGNGELGGDEEGGADGSGEEGAARGVGDGVGNGEQEGDGGGVRGKVP